MNRIDISLKNCYGIPDLSYNFDFSDKKPVIIYAPNGVMKTSFAKSFKDLSNGQDSKDNIFPDRITERNICDENGTIIPANNVFVIDPYDREYHSKRISTLLVNNALKKRYEEIHSDIDVKKKELLKGLKKLSGIKKDDEIERELSFAFTSDTRKFYTSIQRMCDEVNDKAETKYDVITYSKIFNPKVLEFLGDIFFKDKLDEYITKYNSLLESSTFFKKGVFNHYNASTIAKNLKDNGFFKAQHAIYLNQNGEAERKLINDETELVSIIQQEKDNIINNDELKKTFEDIDKKLSTNQDLRDFREFLGQNPTILTELNNLNALKQNLWIRYCQIYSQQYNELVDVYKVGKVELEQIISQAQTEHTQWLDVIEEFNRRFSVPFQLSVDNQSDVILKSEAPSIKFTFRDTRGEKTVKEEDLFAVLSNGELRALYLLNIIFEVEARKKNSIETLFIIDDIADSFDYKNKYAIIEYLYDISKEEQFKQIILTHNYDFYRTVSSRLSVPRNKNLTTIKSQDTLILKEEKYQNNPFLYWKQHFHKEENATFLIASIPFVRNLAECLGDDENFNKLTHLLHIKEDTQTLTIKNIEEVYKQVLENMDGLSLQNPDKPIYNLINETAEKIMNRDEINMELDDKIVLAIAIRLRAELYIISKIQDDTFVRSITKNATNQLIHKYKELFPQNMSVIKVLNQVNIMTPENIHVNSFMYEPILDMSNHHLKTLYTKVLALQ